MKILALETSTMLGGAALADDTGLVAELRLNVKSTHSERLMTAVDRLLNLSGTTLQDIDVFAAASGPGSFTGLRIGLSTVKGLCFATGKPLVMVPTLEAYAAAFAFAAHPVCLMLDARKGEVYAALFRWEGRTVKLREEVSARPEELFHDIPGPVILAGEGAEIYRSRLSSLLGDRAVFAPPAMMVPSPVHVALLGLEKARSGQFADPAAAEPFYIRKSEAEVKWAEKR